MTTEQLIQRISSVLQKTPDDIQAAEDYFEMVKVLLQEDKTKAQEYNRDLLALTGTQLRTCIEIGKQGRYYDLRKKTLLVDAPVRFDSYLQYVEYDRKPEARFYLPRRRYLGPMVRGYQDVLDGNLDLLTISQPKRTGKSQTGINFVNMISGKNPAGSTLMEGMGDALVRSFYDGCNEILGDPQEYLHYEVFPSPRVSTNADIKTINLEKKSRFPTIMCRSIDASQVGLSEATNVLYLDDLVDPDVEAQDRNKLDRKWEKLTGDVMGRRLQGTPIVMSGTRYSIYDPIGRAQDMAQQVGWRWRAIEIPALDPDTDESNYEHVKDGKKIFTTGYLRTERDILSARQWESEFQQQPFESKGLMFPEDQLNRFIELPPDKEPDAIISACDTAESGKDSCCQVIAAIYGDDVYVVDVVFDNSPSDVTKPQCAKKLVEHHVSVATFESNSAGEYFARDVADLVKSLGGKTSIRTKRTITNKLTRIEFASDGILKNFFFKDKSKYKSTDQYGMFMREVAGFTRTGKQPHDDGPDALSLLENEIRNLVGNKAEVFKRLF